MVLGRASTNVASWSRTYVSQCDHAPGDAAHALDEAGACAENSASDNDIAKKPAKKERCYLTVKQKEWISSKHGAFMGFQFQSGFAPKSWFEQLREEGQAEGYLTHANSVAGIRSFMLRKKIEFQRVQAEICAAQIAKEKRQKRKAANAALAESESAAKRHHSEGTGTAPHHVLACSRLGLGVNGGSLLYTRRRTLTPHWWGITGCTLQSTVGQHTEHMCR